MPTVADEIRRYLETGKSDPAGRAWDAPDALARCQRASAELSAALIAALRECAATVPRPTLLPVENYERIALTRIAPMVRGLFPEEEHDIVLDFLGTTTRFVTADNVESLILAADHPSNAWDIANLHLLDIGAPLLSDRAPRIVGFNAGAVSYVSMAYFRPDEDSEFADFVVHEAAHVLHTCKRRDLALLEKRNQPWLLPVAFRERENFAYACEAFSRVADRDRPLKERRARAAKFAEQFRPNDRRVSRDKVIEIVDLAASGRHGWRTILAHCCEE